MEPVEYLRGLRRRWRVIVTAVVVGATVAWLTTLATPRNQVQNNGRFESKVLILDARGGQFGQGGGQGTAAVPLNTIAELVTLEAVANRAANHLKGETDAEALAADVTAAADSETGILTITATGDTGRQAERLASAFAAGLRGFLEDQRHEELQTQIRALNRQLEALPASGRGSDSSLRFGLQSQLSEVRADLASPLGIPVLERTTAHRVEQTGLTAPSSPQARILMGALLGFLGGLAIALTLERLDQKISNWKLAEGLFDAPLLGEIPRLRRRAKSLAVLDSTTSRGADAFRLLASTVLHAIQEGSQPAATGNGHGGEPAGQTLAITSAIRAEGKSAIAANLAAVFGELGIRTIVISFDLRSPTVHRYFGVPGSPGLADAIRSWDGRPGFRRILQSTRAPNVSIIGAGSVGNSPAAILASGSLRNLIQYARDEAQIVILDTPAILLSGDALQQVREADSVLLVARIGKTTITAAQRGAESLRQLGANVIGYALNCSNTVGSAWRQTHYRVEKAPAGETTPGRLPAVTRAQGSN
jgi:capsular exopolysaccharide synthesis family protein